MRFIVVGLLGVCLFAAVAFPSLASDEPDLSAHSAVGSWLVESTFEPGGSRELLMTFFVDGNVVATDAAGHTWHGAWEARGERWGRYTLVLLARPNTGDRGATLFGGINVSPDGSYFTDVAPDSLAPSRVKGERIVVQ